MEKLDEWGYPIHLEYNFEKPEGDFETRIALVIVFSLIIIGIIIIWNINMWLKEKMNCTEEIVKLTNDMQKEFDEFGEVTFETKQRLN